MAKADEQLSREGLQQSKLNALTQPERERLSAHYHAMIADANFLEAPRLATWRALTDTFQRLAYVSNDEKVADIRGTHAGIDAAIEALYSNRIYLLKQGAIEYYTGTKPHALDEIIQLCENNLNAWLADPASQEIRNIVARVVV